MSQDRMNATVPRFYSRPGLHVKIYDERVAREWETLHHDAAFYLEEAKAVGGPVLELGCGTGRLMIPLLSTGFDIHGLDTSTAMLEVARQKREQLLPNDAKRLHLHPGDMSNFDLDQQFAFVFIAFRWRFTEINAGGKVVCQEEEDLQLRWTFRYEMRHLVESCGFVVETEYSDFQRSPPEYGKEQILIFKVADTND